MTPGLSSREEEGDEEGAGTSNFKEDFLEVPQNTADYISGAKAISSVRETKKCLIAGQQSAQLKIGVLFQEVMVRVQIDL